MNSGSRPSEAFAVGHLGRLQYFPKSSYWTNRIRFIDGTFSLSLFLPV